VIAVDWGTTGFRAYRLDAGGRILESRSAPDGILSVKDGAFAQVLERHAGDWIAAGDHPIVMSGMIGSRQGWIEVPYAACPAGFGEIAAGARRVAWAGRQAWIAPGISCRSASGVPDVMRGEEMQILGALDAIGAGSQTVCLPGTHSKWVEVSDQRILRLATYMTGEAFAVLKAHSILGRMMRDGADDSAAFEDGVRRSGQEGGLLNHLFGVRARGLFGELPDAAAASYLSGVLVGHEIRAAHRGDDPVRLLGTPPLCALYQRALAVLGKPSSLLDPDAVVHSLRRLAAMLPA
jgi:2-dehydro-3-deoxygalactonokinase